MRAIGLGSPRQMKSGPEHSLREMALRPGGRLIGPVRVHVVEVEEERRLELAQELARPRGDAAGVAPQTLLVEALEAAPEAAAGVEAGGRDAHDRARRHRGGREAGLRQDLGQRHLAGGDAHRVAGLAEEARRVARGEERVDRREGARRLAPGALEEHALGGEGIEVGRRGAAVAVGADVVGAQRVDQHEDDVARRRRAAAGEARRGRPTIATTHPRRKQAAALAVQAPLLREGGRAGDPVEPLR